MLNTTTRTTPAGPVLDVHGDLDFHTVPSFRRTLEGVVLLPGQRLVLNLAGLRFCDSSGITALLVARNLAASARADVSLAAVPESTLRVLRIVGLDQVFPIEPAAPAGYTEHTAHTGLDGAGRTGRPHRAGADSA
ncbi:STAS domain-containing protein [Streptomyces sp. NPDC016309]|uniref:STAS domain-containing protein n=1 Tax=Streptomyces sp. NPDC016309 TaxID=3364965 RepID=UPI0036F4CBF6